MQVQANVLTKWSSICQWSSCINQRIHTDVSVSQFISINVCSFHRSKFGISISPCRAANSFQFVRNELVGNGNIKRLRQNSCAIGWHPNNNACANFNRTMLEHLVIIIQLVHRSESGIARSESSARWNEGKRIEYANVRWTDCDTAVDHKRQRYTLFGMGLSMVWIEFVALPKIKLFSIRLRDSDKMLSQLKLKIRLRNLYRKQICVFLWRTHSLRKRALTLSPFYLICIVNWLQFSSNKITRPPIPFQFYYSSDKYNLCWRWIGGALAKCNAHKNTQ